MARLRFENCRREVARDESVPYVEMPAKIVSMETIDGEVWAVLEGGATVRVSDLLEDRASGVRH